MDDLERQRIIQYLKENPCFSSIKDIEKKVDAWADAYPIDLLKEIKKAYAWLLTNDAQRKKVGRFLINWFTTACGPQEHRPPSVDEVVKKLTHEIEKKMDLKAALKAPRGNHEARMRELKKQAEMILQRERDDNATQTEK